MADWSETLKSIGYYHFDKIHMLDIAITIGNTLYFIHILNLYYLLIILCPFTSSSHIDIFCDISGSYNNVAIDFCVIIFISTNLLHHLEQWAKFTSVEIANAL